MCLNKLRNARILLKKIAPTSDHVVYTQSLQYFSFTYHFLGIMLNVILMLFFAFQITIYEYRDTLRGGHAVKKLLFFTPLKIQGGN